MKKVLMILLAGLMMFSLAFADDMHHGQMDDHGHAHGKYLNNVVAVDADGNQTALCGCGAEFPVTEKSKSVTVDGMTVYACCDACAEKMAAMDEKMAAGRMGELQMAMDKHEHMATNAMMKDGKMMATCPCGMEVTVDDHTPYVVENGAKIYVCSDKCVEGFSAADMEMRAKAESKARMESGMKMEKKEGEKGM